MILISPAQCRAARALLNWSQPELAERCDMHVQTISAFESENGSPTKTTLDKILKTFESQGIELLPNHGVCLAKNKIYKTESMSEIMDDMLQMLEDGDEVLLHCADERRSPQEVVEKYKALKAKGIKVRATICEGNTYLRDGIPSRWIPKDYFADSEVFVIYADKFVIHIDGYKGQNSEFLTIKNKALADAMRRQFEYWWKNGKKVPIL